VALRIETRVETRKCKESESPVRLWSDRWKHSVDPGLTRVKRLNLSKMKVRKPEVLSEPQGKVKKTGRKTVTRSVRKFCGTKRQNKALKRVTGGRNCGLGKGFWN